MYSHEATQEHLSIRNLLITDYQAASEIYLCIFQLIEGSSRNIDGLDDYDYEINVYIGNIK